MHTNLLLRTALLCNMILCLTSSPLTAGDMPTVRADLHSLTITYPTQDLPHGRTELNLRISLPPHCHWLRNTPDQSLAPGQLRFSDSTGTNLLAHGQLRQHHTNRQVLLTYTLPGIPRAPRYQAEGSLSLRCIVGTHILHQTIFDISTPHTFTYREHTLHTSAATAPAYGRQSLTLSYPPSLILNSIEQRMLHSAITANFTPLPPDPHSGHHRVRVLLLDPAQTCSFCMIFGDSEQQLTIPYHITADISGPLQATHRPDSTLPALHSNTSPSPCRSAVPVTLTPTQLHCRYLRTAAEPNAGRIPQAHHSDILRESPFILDLAIIPAPGILVMNQSILVAVEAQDAAKELISAHLQGNITSTRPSITLYCDTLPEGALFLNTTLPLLIADGTQSHPQVRLDLKNGGCLTIGGIPIHYSRAERAHDTAQADLTPLCNITLSYPSNSTEICRIRLLDAQGKELPHHRSGNNLHIPLLLTPGSNLYLELTTYKNKRTIHLPLCGRIDLSGFTPMPASLSSPSSPAKTSPRLHPNTP